MNDARIASYSGACAVLGGIAWVAASLIHASQPRGCVGDECGALPMRNATSGTVLLVGLAGVMMVASGAGFLMLIKRRSRLGRTGILGAALCAFGLAVLALAAIVQELSYEGDFWLMPAFVVPGAAALAGGLALVSWTVLRSRLLPTWSGGSLLAGALLLLGANEQTAAVLLAVPFGLAWVATGITLCCDAQASHRQPQTQARKLPDQICVPSSVD